MIWINEIESTKLTEDGLSCLLGLYQTNFEVLDSKIASGVKKIINGDCFKKGPHGRRICTERKRFLTGRQVAWMIHEYFKVQRHRRFSVGLR